MAKRNKDLRIGTSGWTYDHWRGRFYPQELPDDQWLEHYAQRFRSVEINNSFYHLPAAKTLRRWCDSVPPDFVFTAKGSRYITHMKKLKDPQEGIVRFIERISVLGDRLGPVLFQMPPNWSFNEKRLKDFLDSLSGEFRYAFEFRDQRWLNERTYEALAEHGAAFCIYELDGFMSPKQVTADFIYIRLHGPGGPYQGSYGDSDLSGWAGAISAWHGKGMEVYCYFDNDEAGNAADNARRLQDMLGDKVS